MRNIKHLLFRLSGMFILFSALLYLFEPTLASWIMGSSVVLFTICAITSPYPGKSIRGKRLFNFQILACLLMIVGTYMMFRHHNEWALFMIIGALFLLYSAIMMPKVLESERDDE